MSRGKISSVWVLSMAFSLSTGEGAWADFRIVPGMTMRTNSPACLAKYQDFYSLAGAYFNGVPAISTLKRVDVLSGGLAFDNATASPVVGKQKTQLYAVSSSYGSVTTGNGALVTNPCRGTARTSVPI